VIIKKNTLFSPSFERDPNKDFSLVKSELDDVRNWKLPGYHFNFAKWFIIAIGLD